MLRCSASGAAAFARPPPAPLPRSRRTRAPPGPPRAAAPAFQTASSSTNGSGVQQAVLARRSSSVRLSRLAPVGTELAAALAPLARLAGVDAAALSRAASKELGEARQHGLVQHGTQVVAHLQQLGVKQPQLGALLLSCPQLFSLPAQQRAAPLLGQLMGRLGLTAAQAARCFEQQPFAANGVSFEPAIEALAELFAAASSGEAVLGEAERQAGEQRLGQLLRDVPAAVTLANLDGTKLRQRCTALRQRYGLSPRQLVAAVRANWSLLAYAPDGHLAAVEAVLQGQLGVDGRALVGAMLRATPRAVTCSVDTLRQRAGALVEAFTQPQLQALKPGLLAVLLSASTATWQLALAVWRALGVPDPAALGLRSALVLGQNWLAPARLANLLALQRSLGLTCEATVVQRFAGYVATSSGQLLADRLLFLEQERLLPLLVAREQRGRPPKGAPPRIGLRDVAMLRDARFCALAALPRDAAERYGEFMDGLPSHPPYQQLLEDAAALRARLRRDPEVARLAAATAGGDAEQKSS